MNTVAQTSILFGTEAGTAHNFSAPGDEPRYYQPMFIPVGSTFIASFQWDQPFYSAGGEGSVSDFDIYLMNDTGGVVASGTTNNIASGDPVEVFSFENLSETDTYYIVILRHSGPATAHLKYIMFGDGAFYLTSPAIPGILSPTIVGHAKAEGAIATAAAFFLSNTCLFIGHSLCRTIFFTWWCCAVF